MRRVTQFCHFIDAIGEIHANDSRRDDTEGQKPLENSGAFAAIGRAEAFGQIERDDHANKPRADALQQSAQDQRSVALCQRDDRHTQHKHDPADRHQPFAPQPISQHPGEQRRNHAPQQHRRNNEGKLARSQPRGRLQIWKRTADDSDIHAEKQSAKTRDKKKEAVVTGLGGVSHFLLSAFCSGLPKQRNQNLASFGKKALAVWHVASLNSSAEQFLTCAAVAAISLT